MQWGVGGGYEAKDLPSTVTQWGVGGGTGYEAKDLPSTVCNVLWLAVYAPDVRHRDKSSTTISGYNQRGQGVHEEGHVMTE